MSALGILERTTAALNDARMYLEMIGKPQPNTTAKADGYLHTLKVETQVHFQPSDGATNYHSCKEFDFIFSKVVKENFSAMAAIAISILEQKVHTATEAAREEYKRRFGEILETAAKAEGRAP